MDTRTGNRNVNLTELWLWGEPTNNERTGNTMLDWLAVGVTVLYVLLAERRHRKQSLMIRRLKFEANTLYERSAREKWSGM